MRVHRFLSILKKICRRMCAVATLAIIAPVSAQQQPARQPASVQTQGKPKDNGGEISYIWKQQYYIYLDGKKTLFFSPRTANIKPALADTDADGDLDLYFGTEDGTVAYAENIGTAKEPDFELRERYLHYLTPDEGVKPIQANKSASPAFYDYDNDGDHDLFVADAKGQIYLYQNTGTPKNPLFMLVPRSFIKMDFSAEPVIAFTDINGDSLNDLVYGTQDGTLAYIPNTGTFQNPEFVSPPMIIYTAENIERIAPAFDDWDGDGLTDILTGSADGGLRLFLNRGTAKEPRYVQSVLKDFSYETDVDGYSVPLFADLNGDGKKDLLTGSITGKIRYYQSRTDAEEKRALWSMSDNLLNYYAPVNYGSHSSVVLTDVNGDNAADMITGEADGTLNLYINENKSQAVPNYHQASYNITTEYKLSNPVPELGDLNGDSFPDMLVCNGDGNLIYFRHNADRKNPAWILESYSFYNIRNTGRCAVRLIDFDRDSDLDLFTADSEGNMVYYENIGDKKVPKMIEADFPYGEKNFPKFSVPAFMDWRQNGVPSMIFGTADAGMYVIKDPLRSDYLRILANTKRGENTDISRYTHYVAEEIPYIRLNGTQGQLIPYTADYNSDGKTDLLIGTDRGEVLAYINVGYEQFEPLKQVVIEQVSNLPPVFDSGRIIANTGHKRVSLSVGDLDGDYDNDLVYGDDKGDIYWLRNSGDQFEFNFLPGDTFLLIKTGRQNVSPVLYDIDRDSDLDIIAGSKDGEFMLYENTGDRKNHSFTPVSGAFQNIRVSRNAVPAAVYLGGQGVSLIAGDILGKLSILRGTRPQGKNWRFELLNRISLSTDVGIAAAPFIGDMNIDGIPEIIIGSDSGRLTVLQSQGSFLSGAFQGKPDYVPRYNFPAGTFPALADTDDDSDADLLVGTMDGQIIYFNNTAVKEK